MISDHLKILNEKQLEAIYTNLDATLVVAGAGSGKTAVLVHKIVYLVTELGLSPNKILAITFTNKAATEMKNRINKMVENASFSWLGTFHSICLKILREDSQKIGRKNDFTIVDEEDQLSIIKELYTKHLIDKNILSPKLCLSHIGRLKSSQVEIEHCYDSVKTMIEEELNDFKLAEKRASIIELVYKEYLQYFIINNYFDFDDLIFYTLKLLKENYTTLQKWKSKFDFILVDEFQDTNYEQYELIKLLSNNQNSIFVVGDPDQMIYSWRGAYKDIFNDFIKDFEDVKTIILDKNYRSTKSIIDVSNQLIAKNGHRIKKELYTDNWQGNKVTYYHAASDERETSWVAEKINYLISKDEKYKDIVILYRSNFVSRAIEQKLIRTNIPYFIYGGLKFYQRKEIKDIIAYLKLICNNDDISLSRIYNVPRRKITETTFNKIKKYSLDHNISLFEAFNYVEELDLQSQAKNACLEFKKLIDDFKSKKFNSLAELYDYVIEKTEYLKMLEEVEETHRKDNLDELKNAIKIFELKNPNSTLSEYLQEITLYTTLDEESKNNHDSIRLMTVHLAKGLEFKHVFIVGFNEKIFPSSKAINENNLEEERRIAYVAMTRARDNLFITSSSGISFYAGDKLIKEPSRFYLEIKKNKNLDIIDESYISLLKNQEDKWFDSNNKKDYDQNFHENAPDFNIGDSIVHTMFGSGIITSINDDVLEILFKHPHGTKSIVKNHKSIIRKLE